MRFMILAVLGLGILAMLSSCQKRTEAEIIQQQKRMQDYTQRENPEVVDVNPSDRIIVNRISVIQDSLAYGDKRGVYVIIDTKTGKEYIGVSGVGITEAGSHTVSSGKTTSTREHEH